MIATLIKKQMMEIFSLFRQNKKKSKAHSGAGAVGMALVYLFLFAVVAMLFFMIAGQLCGPLVSAGMAWLYFGLMGLISIALGAFGSVFSTYATLYLAKDNAMLLAMPVRPGQLLFARLFGVYAMGFLYELLVMIPTLIVYFVSAKPGFAGVIFPILITLVLSVLILVLSTVLGFVVALVSVKTRHKSLLTVVLSLAFIAAYYYLYGKGMQLLENIALAPQGAAEFVRDSLYPVYQMGVAAAGDGSAFLIFTAIVLAAFGVVYLALTKSYLWIATMNKGETKKVYRERALKKSSADSALLRKEAKRFLSSPSYMLNCGLGIVIMVAAAVAALIKGDVLAVIMYGIFGSAEGAVPLVACAMLCLISCMNDITAPSVSLEGKNLWLVRAFPVSTWQVLWAKLRLHLLLTLIPMLFLVVSVEIALQPEPLYAVMIPVAVSLFVWFMAEFGLVMNLLAPNLDWTNENVPVKQGMSVMFALFGGWVLVAALGGLYALAHKVMGPAVYLGCVSALLLLMSAALWMWLKTSGVRRFEQL